MKAKRRGNAANNLFVGGLLIVDEANYMVLDASLTNSTALVWLGALRQNFGVDDLGNTII